MKSNSDARNSAQFPTIPRNSVDISLLPFRNYSAIARNEIMQAEATIARNYAQLRAILRNEISIGNPNYIIYDTVILLYYCI